MYGEPAKEIEQISGALRGVTAGLATAFETTLVALVAALFIQLALTGVSERSKETSARRLKGYQLD